MVGAFALLGVWAMLPGVIVSYVDEANAAELPVWPTASGDERLSDTIPVSGVFDGGMVRFSGLGDGGQSEDQPPLFEVADGGTVKNVILGPPAGDGIHCRGSCILMNVWWEDVGEDAATLKDSGNPNPTMVIDGGGAGNATDKVFQHNGGGLVVIRNFQARDVGKLYRSCGTCDSLTRHVEIENVTVSGVREAVLGLNSDNGDTAEIKGLTILEADRAVPVCRLFDAAETGGEPVATGVGPDVGHCSYGDSTVTRR